MEFVIKNETIKTDKGPITLNNKFVIVEKAPISKYERERVDTEKVNRRRELLKNMRSANPNINVSDKEELYNKYIEKYEQIADKIGDDFMDEESAFKSYIKNTYGGELSEDELEDLMTSPDIKSDIEKYNRGVAQEIEDGERTKIDISEIETDLEEYEEIKRQEEEAKEVETDPETAKLFGDQTGISKGALRKIQPKIDPDSTIDRYTIQAEITQKLNKSPVMRGIKGNISDITKHEPEEEDYQESIDDIESL